MRLLQFILSLILLYFFLLIAWPVFLVLLILFASYWIWAVWKLRKAANRAFEDLKQHEAIERPVESKDVIDAQFTEREE